MKRGRGRPKDKLAGVRVYVGLTKAQVEKLDALVVHRMTTRTQVIREAVQMYLRKIFEAPDQGKTE